MYEEDVYEKYLLGLWAYDLDRLLLLLLFVHMAFASVITSVWVCWCYFVNTQRFMRLLWWGGRSSLASCGPLVLMRNESWVGISCFLWLRHTPRRTMKWPA